MSSSEDCWTSSEESDPNPNDDSSEEDSDEEDEETGEGDLFLLDLAFDFGIWNAKNI